MEREYTVRESSYRNFSILQIGSEIDIFINENGPTDFYVK